jgi:excisionase family DNA binding protein
MSTGPFLGVPEVARWLSRTPARCYQMVRAGELPAVRVGGRLVVPRAAWEAWLKGCSEAALASVHSRAAQESTPETVETED